MTLFLEIVGGWIAFNVTLAPLIIWKIGKPRREAKAAVRKWKADHPGMAPGRMPREIAARYLLG